MFTGARANVVHVGADRGLIPEELEKTVEELKAQGRRIKFLYTIPSFQNLGGTLMPPRSAVTACARSATPTTS